MSELHIGHYALGRTIGTGGFAKVKEARHDKTGVRVAVKIINKRKMKNKNMIAKVKREIKILKFINHQNIIKLYEVLDTTNDIFVVMELAEGGELYDYIQNNDISEQEAKFFFRQIISGVGHAHTNLIAHRDLKPENILIEGSKLIKIVDFGLSNIMKDGKLLKTACGSPNYAAPEIVGERHYQGTSVDIWSCGVILYALLVGSLPFDQETVTLLYRKIEQGIYHIPARINPMAADLIRRMLQVDPYHRIRINDIENHPWLRRHVPLYTKIPNFNYRPKDETFELDEEIFNTVRCMNFLGIEDVPSEKLKKSIKKKEDNSFAITYELLCDEKYRKRNTEISLLHYSQEEPPGKILKDMQNAICLSQQFAGCNSLYGKRINKPLKILAQIVIIGIRRLGIEFTIKNKQYCFKCTFKKKKKGKSRTVSPRKQYEMKDQNDQKEETSFKEVKFLIQIYSVDIKGYEHMIDLQILEGHPLSFMALTNRFNNMIDFLCQNH